MSQKVYVGNLSYSITNQDLKAMFEQYGNVDSANVIMDRETNRSKGFGFVEMTNKNEATEAITTLNGSEFQGRALNVSEAKPQAPKERRSFSNYR